jgi:hypothetical protein
LEASTINQPHPDDGAIGVAPDHDAEEAVPFPPEADDFFGEPTPGVADGPVGSYAPDSGVAGADPGVSPGFEGEGALEPFSDGDEDQPQAEKVRGAIEREYVVFQQVPLTATVLRTLLTRLEQEHRAPRVAFFELHRTVTRNDRDAARQAYKANREALGVKCELGVVSSRSFKIRHVAPAAPVKEPRVKIS